MTGNAEVDRRSRFTFLDHFDEFEKAANGQSIFFFYLNYDNPLNAEERKFLLVDSGGDQRVCVSNPLSNCE
jgi:hypothetical protein